MSTPENETTLRDVMRVFPQGVVVVTAEGDEGPRGITVSAFTSLSLMPPLVLICIMKTSQAHASIEKGGFVVNVLADDQGAVSDHFATPNLTSEEQFKDHASGSSERIPRIDGCLGYLECRVVDRHFQGDHTVFIGEVERAEMGKEGSPLVFCDRQYRGLGGVVYERG